MVEEEQPTLWSPLLEPVSKVRLQYKGHQGAVIVLYWSFFASDGIWQHEAEKRQSFSTMPTLHSSVSSGSRFRKAWKAAQGSSRRLEMTRASREFFGVTKLHIDQSKFDRIYRINMNQQFLSDGYNVGDAAVEVVFDRSAYLAYLFGQQWHWTCCVHWDLACLFRASFFTDCTWCRLNTLTR